MTLFFSNQLLLSTTFLCAQSATTFSRLRHKPTVVLCLQSNNEYCSHTPSCIIFVYFPSPPPQAPPPRTTWSRTNFTCHGVNHLSWQMTSDLHVISLVRCLWTTSCSVIARCCIRSSIPFFVTVLQATQQAGVQRYRVSLKHEASEHYYPIFSLNQTKRERPGNHLQK